MKDKFSKIYSTTLMQDGGHTQGWFTDDAIVMDGIKSALAQLKAKSKDNMLFAVGDGNHSLAAAKVVWDKRKKAMTPEERAQSPLRYALCEVVNLFDPGISVHPIHRVLFNVQDASSTLRTLVSILNRSGQDAHMMYTRGTRAVKKDGVHTILFESKMSKGHIEVKKPMHPLVSQTLTEALDLLAEEMPRVNVDYIHGDEEFHEHTKSHACLGFIMEPMQKDEIFNNVIQYGVLPKKSFSLGLAEEKRYYFECRLLVEADDDKPEEEAQEQPEKTALPDAESFDTAQLDAPTDEPFDEPDLNEEESDSRASRKPRRSIFGRKRD